MKITKRQLKQIIREERAKLSESFDDDQYEYGPRVSEDESASSLEDVANDHLKHLENYVNSYESFDDRRARDIEMILFRAYEKIVQALKK